MGDARAEAEERLGGRYEVRVLEPSPPTVHEGPWFADDPVGEPPPGGRELVTPVEGLGDLTWDELCGAADHPGLAGWCADRWLGAWRRLEPLPAGFATTRLSLHMLAEHVLAPARHAFNGKIGLRFTRGGFGTPFFGDDRQVRVERGVLVVGDGPAVPITTIAAAAAAAGTAPGCPDDVYTPSTTWEPDAPLPVDAAAASALGEWYGFCASVLEQLRADARYDPSLAPSRVQLWPEHFDLAVELGDEAAGGRASFGGSPGDQAHPEPYLYVSPWTKRAGAFWSDAAFTGASLSYGDLLAAGDQRAVAFAFLSQGLKELAG